MSDRIRVFDGVHAVEAAKALGSEVRVAILDIVGRYPLTISQLALELGIAQPAVTNHVQVLERAGLLKIFAGTGERGATKLCSRTYDEVHLRFTPLAPPDAGRRTVLHMPVGNFSRCRITPTCGLASANSIVGFLDDPRSFYLPERTQAELLWFGWGFVEYDFTNPLLKGQDMDRIDISLEICSEAPGYSEEYPSDITFSINGVEVGTWTSPGDMGRKAGTLNPAWWSLHSSTQYGFLKTLSVRNDGTFIDGTRVSSVTPDAIIDYSCHAVTLRLEVKEAATHRGGLTIFGKSFGNYPQDLVFMLTTK